MNSMSGLAVKGAYQQAVDLSLSIQDSHSGLKKTEEVTLASCL